MGRENVTVKDAGWRRTPDEEVWCSSEEKKTLSKVFFIYVLVSKVQMLA